MLAANGSDVAEGLSRTRRRDDRNDDHQFNEWKKTFFRQIHLLRRRDREKKGQQSCPHLLDRLLLVHAGLRARATTTVRIRPCDGIRIRGWRQRHDAVSSCRRAIQRDYASGVARGIEQVRCTGNGETSWQEIGASTS